MFSWRDNALVIAHMTHNLMLLVLMNKNHPNKAGVPKLKSGVKSLVLLWGLPTTPDNIFWVICHNLIFLFGLLAFHCHFTFHFHRILRDFLILFKKSFFCKKLGNLLTIDDFTPSFLTWKERGGGDF